MKFSFFFYEIENRYIIKKKHEQCEQSLSFSYIDCSLDINLITINKYKKTYNPTIWPSKNEVLVFD